MDNKANKKERKMTIETLIDQYKEERNEISKSMESTTDTVLFCKESGQREMLNKVITDLTNLIHV